MLRLATSYFYQIRFFKKYMFPISTAVWDPKWYHAFKGQNHVFIDKRGVVNGLRIQPLMPGSECDGLCRGLETCNSRNPYECEFLHTYRKQLDAINFDEFMQKLELNITELQRRLNINMDPIAVFIVHEVPDKICSERGTIQDWFESHGLFVKELRYPIDEYYLW